MTPIMSAIEVRSLRKTYGDVHALRGIDLAIAGGGHIVGLLGPNGAGKTTLVEILEGLRTATSGSAAVLGLDPQTAPAALRARLGVQLQETAFIPELTVLETLRLYAALYPRSLAPADVLARVDLVDKGKALVRTLSGGQRQRLALALAMLHDPDLFILDEPTTGLDPAARRQIHDILRGLRARGKTVLISSHYLEEIEALADRVVILSQGAIVADGTPLELLARAAGASTLWLAVSGSFDAARLVPGAAFEGLDGALFRYRTPDPTAAIVGLADSLRASGARLDDLRLKRPSLEDVYLQLVGHPIPPPPAARARRPEMFPRSVLALVRAQLIELRRSKTALFWMMAFPIGFLLLFGFVMARGDARVTGVLMPGLLTTTLMSGALFGVALPLVQQRENGLLRRLRVTPVTAAAVAIAHGITAILTGFLSMVLLMALARAIFGMQMAGSWPALTGVFLCGAVALVPMGMLLGSAARDIRTAPAIANLIFFPMMFLSGSAMPFAVLPEGVKRFARLLPTTYLDDTYSSVIVRGEGLSTLLGSLAVLIAVGVVGTILTSMLFRWEGTEPIPRRSLAIIAVAFAATLGVSALAAPAFRMGDLPGARRIEAGAAQGQVRVLRGATVLDGLGGRIANARVVIRDHRIAEVTLDDERTPLPEGAIVETLGGRYLIPGLFDSHVHWGGSGGIGASPVEQIDDRMLRDFGATLAAASPRWSRSPTAWPTCRRWPRRSHRHRNARRARSSPGRRSRRRAATRRRCSASCRDWPSSSRARWRRRTKRGRRSPSWIARAWIW